MDCNGTKKIFQKEQPVMVKKPSFSIYNNNKFFGRRKKSAHMPLLSPSLQNHFNPSSSLVDLTPFAHSAYLYSLATFFKVCVKCFLENEPKQIEWNKVWTGVDSIGLFILYVYSFHRFMSN